MLKRKLNKKSQWFAIESFERQTLPRPNSFMLVHGRYDRPFVVYIHHLLWYDWFHK